MRSISALSLTGFFSWNWNGQKSPPRLKIIKIGIFWQNAKSWLLFLVKFKRSKKDQDKDFSHEIQDFGEYWNSFLMKLKPSTSNYEIFLKVSVKRFPLMTIPWVATLGGFYGYVCLFLAFICRFLQSACERKNKVLPVIRPNIHGQPPEFYGGNFFTGWKFHDG